MDGIDLLVKNGAVWTPGGFVDADIAVKDGKIAALGKPPVLPDTAAAMIDAKGMKVIPGLIDTHTHHRDPGFTHKEDITTATMHRSFQLSSVQYLEAAILTRRVGATRRMIVN